MYGKISSFPLIGVSFPSSYLPEMFPAVRISYPMSSISMVRTRKTHICLAKFSADVQLNRPYSNVRISSSSAFRLGARKELSMAWRHFRASLSWILEAPSSTEWTSSILIFLSEITEQQRMFGRGAAEPGPGRCSSGLGSRVKRKKEFL